MQIVDERYREEAHSSDHISKLSFKYKSLIGVLILTLLIGIIISLSVGDIEVSFREIIEVLTNKVLGKDINTLNSKVIWDLRLPRAILACIVGIGLGLCGAIMQSSVQNPLADPYILGISSGTSLGATFSILLGIEMLGHISKLTISISAFIGGMIAAISVMFLSNIGGKMSSTKLVLAGTVINALCSSFSNFIIYSANNAEGIRTITFWTMGSLASADFESILLPGIVVLIGCIFFLTQTRNLNNMMVGEEACITLGIDLNKYRKIYILISVMIIGVLVSECGIIGFLGLIVPHIVRGLVGSDNKKLLPLTILFSGIFLVYSDILSRILIRNAELPIGIITSIIGAPMFMYMMIKESGKFGDK